MERNMNNTKFLVNAGLMIAIATVLSYIKLFELPQGGSITFASMVPIFLISFKYGLKKGIFTGIIYGILQFILQPSGVVHPLQLILDYPLAFGLLGLSGIFSDKILNKNLNNLKKSFYIIVGILISILGRFFCHLISGAIFFKQYAGAKNPWIYSAIYNGSYLSLELLVSCIVTILILNIFNKYLFKS